MKVFFCRTQLLNLSIFCAKWKYGKDEGVLVLLALEQRKVRIEVGYGAEGYLNDAKTGRLLDSYGVPYFKTSDYSRGMLALAVEVAKIVEAEKGVSLTLPAQNYQPGVPDESIELSPFQLILMLIVLIILLSTRFGRALLLTMLISGHSGSGRRGGFGGGFRGGFGGGISGGGGSSRSF